MPRSIILVSSLVTFTALGSAHAQTALSSCDPITGLSSSGQPCVELKPIDPRNIAESSADADGADQYSRLDPSTLGQTYECRQGDRKNEQYGGGASGFLLIEDCGIPAQLSNVKPFYGTTSAPAPVASLPAAAPAPVASLPAAAPAPVASLPAAAPVFATVPAAGAFTSLSGAALTGIVAVGGLAAVIAAASSGGSSTPSTN